MLKKQETQDKIITSNLFQTFNVKTSSWGLETLAQLGPKIWSIIPEDMKKLLSKFNSQNINVINFGSACGIDLKSFKKSNTIKNTIKKEYNFKKNDFLVLYVGRPHERKGFKIIGAI